MKIIDLLSINKKEMPKCIKHYSGIYVWDKEKGDFFKGTGEGLLQWCVSSFDTQNHFIDEIEIIEEDKGISKDIKWYLIEEQEKEETKIAQINMNFRIMREKMAEIIDKINEEK